MVYSFDASKRIKAIRREMVKAIPRFPNDRASLQSLEAKHITDLMITYIGWRIRHVGVRPRQVLGQDKLAADPRAAGLEPNINAFLSAVRRGDDLTPYISLGAVKEGYSPAAETQPPNPNSWADKDFLLNVMGLHHFHLGMELETAGHAKRTNEVVFASVTRDMFEILGLFDHAAFERDGNGAMTPERQRLWSVYEEREVAQSLPGQLRFGGLGDLGVTLSGHPAAVTRAAQHYVKQLRRVDPQLDDPNFVRTLYRDGSIPPRPRSKWHFRHLDLGLLDVEARNFAVVAYGPS